MYSKTIVSLVASSLLLTGVPAAHASPPDDSTSSLKVALADVPRVQTDNKNVELEVVSSEVGEKHFSGKSKSGESVRVVVFEKPVEEDAFQPQESEDVIDWTKTATDYEPAIVEQKIKKGEVPKPSSEMEPSLVTAATKSEVSFSWKPDKEIQKYEIYKDGKLAIVTEESHAEISDLTADTRYIFEVKGISSTDGSGGVSEVKKTIPVSTLGDVAVGQKIAKTYQQYTTAVQYETFIPDAQVDLNFAAVTTCGAFGVSGITFSGDNRTYRTPGAAAPNDTVDYRTMMFTNINWDNAAPWDIINLKHIQATKKYKNGVFQEQKTASNSQMYFSDMQKSGSYAQVRFDHAAGNPFCSVGNIRYNVVNRFYRSGVVETVGYRQQAPAHEAYARFNNSSGAEYWVTILRMPNSNFNCLFEPACGTETINVSLSR